MTMPDWLITYLGSLQGGIVRTLAAELQGDGLAAAWLGFGLGAAYFLGQEARVGKGVPVALVARYCTRCLALRLS